MFSWPTSYHSCFTLSGVISREGIGLHSGEKTRVKISSYEKEGYYVSFRDKPNEIFKLTQDLIGTKCEYEALILLKVGEFSPTETNCSEPMLNLFPEVGFTALFTLFLDVLAIKLTNVFSAGHEPSLGVNPIQMISLIFPVVGVLSP